VKHTLKPFLYFNAFFICAFLLSPLPGFANETCDHIKKQPLHVTINLTEPAVRYDYSKTSKEMTQERREHLEEWLMKNGVKSAGMARHVGQFMEVGGLTVGGYATSYQYQMRAEPVDPYGVYYCPYITQINIELFYQTTIFMPKEKDRNSCDFKETMKHEWKHHTANLLAFKKYTERLKQDVPVIAREIELGLGYIPHGKVQAAFEDIQNSVKRAIDIYLETISDASNALNEKIDTPEEYVRVEKAIKNCEMRRKEKQPLRTTKE